MLDDLRNRIGQLWDQTRPQIIYQPIDVDSVDYKADYVPLKYGRHYIRLWLAHIYLAKQTQYLQNWYPAVHSLVKFDVQGKPVEFPTVADATKVAMTQDAQTGDVIAHSEASFLVGDRVNVQSSIADRTCESGCESP